MESKPSQSTGLQLVGGTHVRPEKSGTKHLKPKNMRRLQINITAAEFVRLQSADDAAQSIREGGINRETVMECLGLNLARRVEALETLLNSARSLAA